MGEKSLGYRFINLRHCVEEYGWLTKQKFNATYQRLGDRLGVTEAGFLDESQLTNAARMLRINS